MMAVATISRRPIETVEKRVLCGIPDSRHLSTRFTAGEMNILIHNFYVPAGGDAPDPEINPKFRHKLDFVAEMRSLIDRVDLVIGTTGWSIPDLKERVGDRIGVVVAPNFSMSIALYARLSLVMARFAALVSDRWPGAALGGEARRGTGPTRRIVVVEESIADAVLAEQALGDPGIDSAQLLERPE